MWTSAAEAPEADVVAGEKLHPPGSLELSLGFGPAEPESDVLGKAVAAVTTAAGFGIEPLAVALDLVTVEVATGFPDPGAWYDSENFGLYEATSRDAVAIESATMPAHHDPSDALTVRAIAEWAQWRLAGTQPPPDGYRAGMSAMRWHAMRVPLPAGLAPGAERQLRVLNDEDFAVFEYELAERPGVRMLEAPRRDQYLTPPFELEILRGIGHLDLRLWLYWSWWTEPGAFGTEWVGRVRNALEADGWG